LAASWRQGIIIRDGGSMNTGYPVIVVVVIVMVTIAMATHAKEIIAEVSVDNILCVV
jgi:hypothetical protein